MGTGMNRYRPMPKLMPAIGLVVLCILAGLLGFSLVQSASRQILEAEARIDAERWSRDLTANIPDLAAIAKGMAPAPGSLELFRRSLAGGNVLSYRIYDKEGHLRLQSDEALSGYLLGKSIAMADSGLASALERQTPATLLRQGKGKAEPAAWTIEFSDPMPNLEGAASLYGYVTNMQTQPNGTTLPGSEIHYDNLKITPAAKK